MNKKFYVVPQVNYADLMVESNFVQSVGGQKIDDWIEDDDPINV